MHKKQKGDVTEAATLSKLVSLGYNPLLPFSENARYDIAVDEDGELTRIQCKTAWKDGEKILFNCSDVRHVGGKVGRNHYTEEEIDGFAVMIPTGELLWIDVNDATKSEMTIRWSPSESKYSSVDSHLVEDYLFEDRF